MTDHKLNDVQTKNQINNWIYGEVNSALDKIETAGEVPSIDHPEIQQMKARYKFLTQDRLTRAIEKWEQKKQKQSSAKCSAAAVVVGEAASVVSVSTADAAKKEDAARTPVELACIKRKDEELFFIEAIDGPFPDPNVPDFGKNVVWAINFLHGKGYSYVENEVEQNSWKKISNSKRDHKDTNIEDRVKEPRAVGIFSKTNGASESETRRPKILVIYQEPMNSDTVSTTKKGMFYLQGSDCEPFGGPHDAVVKAIKQARDLGYEKMNGKEEEHWSNMITKFIREDILFDFYIPEVFDRVVGVFEKKSKP